MRILIIGASGFLGKKAVEILGASNEVIAAAKSPNGKEIKLDVTQKQEIINALDKYMPDLVFNCAGLVDVEGSEKDKSQAWDINLSGPVYLADICKQRNIKLITISSDYVFSGNNSPYEEYEEAHPKSFYGMIKKLMEQAVSYINPDAIIIRPSILYGFTYPGKKDKLVIPVIESLNNKKEVVISDLRPKYPVLLDDFINNAVILVERNESGIFNFASELTDRYLMAKTVAKVFNLDETLIKKGEPITNFNEKPYNVQLINKRAPYLKFSTFEDGVKIIKKQIEESNKTGGML